MSEELRRMDDQQIGYLTAKVEGLESLLKNHIENEESKLEAVHTKLDKALEQLSLYRFMLMFLKTVGYTLLFVLAFKFGDIKSLWKP
jgi:uncharacterized membrane protein YjjP (DUF1212 family)